MRFTTDAARRFGRPASNPAADGLGDLLALHCRHSSEVDQESGSISMSAISLVAADRRTQARRVGTVDLQPFSSDRATVGQCLHLLDRFKQVGIQHLVGAQTSIDELRSIYHDSLGWQKEFS
jgi:hypothetical protein